MKAVLISIQPKWVEKIASGEKTIEVRKSRPKLETPFKVYIYCTIGSGVKGDYLVPSGIQCGKVIGEFVCDKTDFFFAEYCDNGSADLTPSRLIYGLGNSNSELAYLDKCCLTHDELFDYIISGKYGFGWHISDLKIYDKPKELSEFCVEGDCDCMNCKKCYWFDSGNGYNVEDDCNLAYKGIALHKSFKPIIRPPQSWCYVEEVEV